MDNLEPDGGEDAGDVKPPPTNPPTKEPLLPEQGPWEKRLKQEG